jgi:hypothetical protein
LDPATLPRLERGHLGYLGGFRLPKQTVNGDSYSFGGRTLAFNGPSNSLYIGTRSNRVAEVTIPNPVNSADVNALPFASFLQPFADVTEGHLPEVGADGVSLAGLIVSNNRLIATASIYYDALNAQKVSHFSHSLQLNELSFSGWSRLWDAGKTGFVSGFMAMVPSEWQPLLGGPAVTGQCCIPIVTRTSWGPAAFAFNPAQIGQAATSATPLLYYNDVHPNLGRWDAPSSDVYGASTQMGGMAIIEGTRTALYVGRNGMGPNCYGSGTATASLAGTIAPDGELYCYDPTSNDKGTHGYPYRYQLWAYDLNDFAAVKAGTKLPWDVMPYAVWPLELPILEMTVRVGGVGYDAQRQILYISQLSADRDGYEYRPVIHALQIDLARDPNVPFAPTPAPTPTPAPAPPPAAPVSAPVSAVSLVANKTAPQAAGVPVTFTATPTGGVGPHQYKFLVYNGSAWAPVRDWTTSSQFVWTPAAANKEYFVGVWARSAGKTADAAEETSSIPFAISEPANVAVPAVIVGTPNPGSPLTVSVVNGPANRTDWVGLFDVAAPDKGYVQWVYLNGTTTVPANGLANVSLQFTAPSAPGTYDVRLFTNNGFTRIAISAATIVSGNAPPSVTAAKTSVNPGETISFSVANGPANRADWVGLFDVAAPDAGYVQWVYLNGSKTTPANGLANASLQFTVPAKPGTYDVRLFTNDGFTRIARSDAITAGSLVTVAATTVQPGALIELQVTSGPANPTDWVGLFNAAAADNGYLQWMYLNGTTTAPPNGLATASLRFTAPITPGTYDVRLFVNDGFTRIGRTRTITVAP